MNLNKIEAEIKDLVTYSIHVRQEYDAPEGHFASGDDEEDAETCKKIREDSEWNEWAWCIVEVRAEYRGIYGNDFLGCCSYESEKNFREDGYFEDMKTQALSDLINKLSKLQIEE